MKKIKRYTATAFVFLSVFVIPAIAHAGQHADPKRWGFGA